MSCPITNCRWYDLRIDFRDLNNISSLNSMNDNDRSVIWVPKLGFVNALGPFQTVVDDLVTGLLIREDETPLSEEISLPIEGTREVNFIYSSRRIHLNKAFITTSAMLFSGKTNSILMTREYYQEYSCNFHLMYYPFDTQVWMADCSVSITNCL